MTIQTPIQILVFRDPNDQQTEPYVQALRLAIEGAIPNQPITYLADSVDLGIHVVVPEDPTKDTLDIDRILSAADRTVAVIMEPSEAGDVTPSPTFEGNKARLMENLDEHLVVPVPISLAKPPSDLQGERDQSDSFEPALRPTTAALKVMHAARRALSDGPVKLFLSHAKLDGVPSALSLVNFLQQLEVEKFYDVEDIAAGTNWRDKIRSNASSSVLIVLRTNEYESRYWCREEYQLAEKHGMPIVVVDLRTNHYANSARLAFDAAPTVKLTDGNLFRVIMHALGADLRAQRRRCMVESMNLSESFTLLSQRPSEISLAGALDRLDLADHQESDERCLVVYPSPKVTDHYLAATQRLLPKGVELITIDDLN